MVLVGSAEAIGLPKPDYAHYLLLNFPVFGLLKAVLGAAAVRIIFRPGAEVENQAAIRRGELTKDATIRAWPAAFRR